MLRLLLELLLFLTLLYSIILLLNFIICMKNLFLIPMIFVSQFLIAQNSYDETRNLADKYQIAVKDNSSEKIEKEQDVKASKGEFAHVVLFWLKNPDNQQERKKFEASLGTFVKNSKYIKSMHFGPPANTDRPVIDNTYTYCMILTFTSKEEQDKYQDEPGHKTFISESEDLWKKVTVFDSVNSW